MYPGARNMPARSSVARRWLAVSESGGNEPQVQIEAPDLPVYRWEALPERCDFEDETMPIDFQSLRVPMDETWVSLRKRSGFLSIKVGNHFVPPITKA